MDRNRLSRLFAIEALMNTVLVLFMSCCVQLLLSHHNSIQGVRALANREEASVVDSSRFGPACEPGNREDDVAACSPGPSRYTNMIYWYVKEMAMICRELRQNENEIQKVRDDGRT